MDSIDSETGSQSVSFQDGSTYMPPTQVPDQTQLTQQTVQTFADDSQQSGRPVGQTTTSDGGGGGTTRRRSASPTFSTLGDESSSIRHAGVNFALGSQTQYTHPSHPQFHDGVADARPIPSSLPSSSSSDPLPPCSPHLNSPLPPPISTQVAAEPRSTSSLSSPPPINNPEPTASPALSPLRYDETFLSVVSSVRSPHVGPNSIIDHGGGSSSFSQQQRHTQGTAESFVSTQLATQDREETNDHNDHQQRETASKDEAIDKLESSSLPRHAAAALAVPGGGGHGSGERGVAPLTALEIPNSSQIVPPTSSLSQELGAEPMASPASSSWQGSGRRQPEPELERGEGDVTMEQEQATTLGEAVAAEEAMDHVPSSSLGRPKPLPSSPPREVEQRPTPRTTNGAAASPPPASASRLMLSSPPIPDSEAERLANVTEDEYVEDSFGLVSESETLNTKQRRWLGKLVAQGSSVAESLLEEGPGTENRRKTGMDKEQEPKMIGEKQRNLRSGRILVEDSRIEDDEETDEGEQKRDAGDDTRMEVDNPKRLSSSYDPPLFALSSPIKEHPISARSRLPSRSAVATTNNTEEEAEAGSALFLANRHRSSAPKEASARPSITAGISKEVDSMQARQVFVPATPSPPPAVEHPPPKKCASKEPVIQSLGFSAPAIDDELDIAQNTGQSPTPVSKRGWQTAMTQDGDDAGTRSDKDEETPLSKQSMCEGNAADSEPGPAKPKEAKKDKSAGVSATTMLKKAKTTAAQLEPRGVAVRRSARRRTSVLPHRSKEDEGGSSSEETIEDPDDSTWRAPASPDGRLIDGMKRKSTLLPAQRFTESPMEKKTEGKEENGTHTPGHHHPTRDHDESLESPPKRSPKVKTSYGRAARNGKKRVLSTPEDGNEGSSSRKRRATTEGSTAVGNTSLVGNNSKTSGPSRTAPTASTQPTASARVFALWPTDGKSYPGTVVEALPKDRFRILYDDGSIRAVEFKDLRRAVLRDGDRFVAPPGKTKYVVVLPPATSKKKKGGSRSDSSSERRDRSVILSSADVVLEAREAEGSSNGTIQRVLVKTIHILKKDLLQLEDCQITNVDEVTVDALAQTASTQLGTRKATNVVRQASVKSDPVRSSSVTSISAAAAATAGGGGLSRGCFAGMAFIFSSIDGEEIERQKEDRGRVKKFGGVIIERVEMVWDVVSANGSSAGGEAKDGTYSADDLRWRCKGSEATGGVFLVSDEPKRSTTLLRAVAMGVPCLATSSINMMMAHGMTWRSQLLPTPYSDVLQSRSSQKIHSEYGHNLDLLHAPHTHPVNRHLSRPLDGHNVLFISDGSTAKGLKERALIRWLCLAMGAHSFTLRTPASGKRKGSSSSSSRHFDDDEIETQFNILVLPDYKEVPQGALRAGALQTVDVEWVKQTAIIGERAPMKAWKGIVDRR